MCSYKNAVSSVALSERRKKNKKTDQHKNETAMSEKKCRNNFKILLCLLFGLMWNSDYGSEIIKIHITHGRDKKIEFTKNHWIRHNNLKCIWCEALKALFIILTGPYCSIRISLNT